MVSYKTAFKNFFKKGFNFKGTSTRAEYWWMVLTITLTEAALALCLFLTIFLMGGTGSIDQMMDNLSAGALILSIFLILLMVVIILIIIIPMLALQVRRFRDIDLAEPLVWTAFVVLVFGRIVANYFARQYAGMEVLSDILTLLIFILSALPTNCFKNTNWLNRKN
ncbi:uncharacterized membrane protein YhaH (DUF805 family) [Weissella uvarum]|uniref:DUF805 domain-containing protein n=1 Tax=Weissella uvarum TaxID=1479233 RepID=UPI001961E68D|nr:DUF805 domain-containing protein [Weissella uvarum]MBM7617482.1 uncharacterized membrane protein YhaH (DUF805 family) [Weissella uvarum]MCM0595634.1 DUF805 domain-containing protein [Weissella uvarum]